MATATATPNIIEERRVPNFNKEFEHAHRSTYYREVTQNTMLKSALVNPADIDAATQNTMLEHNAKSKEFIKHIDKFKKLHNEYTKKGIVNIEYSKIETALRNTVSTLFQVPYDALSSELTYDSTLFYTIKISEYLFYVEQFFDDELDYVLTVFKDKKPIVNVEGSLSFIMTKIRTTAGID
jgi:hypothetical protein